MQKPSSLSRGDSSIAPVLRSRVWSGAGAGAAKIVVVVVIARKVRRVRKCVFGILAVV